MNKQDLEFQAVPPAPPCTCSPTYNGHILDEITCSMCQAKTRNNGRIPYARAKIAGTYRKVRQAEARRRAQGIQSVGDF